MIISHTHKYLFLKSVKTAGTSIEAALSQSCTGSDVVTPLGDFSHNRDEPGGVLHRAMNTETLRWWDRETIGQHVGATLMRQHVPPEVWEGYCKFSIARNPWDRVVSLFAWRTRNDPAMKPRKGLIHKLGVPFDELRELRRNFAAFVHRGFETNDRFYILDGQLCTDFMIRYEHMNDDLAALAKKLGLPPLNVPRLKTGIRPAQYHYSQYYDEATKALVGDRHAQDLRHFGYRFEAA
jgi:hypothetical protein